MRLIRIWLAVLLCAGGAWAYTTIGGALSANKTYTAGTYWDSARVTSVNYNQTFDCSDGSIIWKSSVTNPTGMIAITGSGDLLCTGTSKTNRIYFTSVNDNSIGDTIAGSTGTPATGDYGYVVNTTADNCDIILSHVTVRYSGSAAGCILFGQNAAATGSDMTLDDVVFSNCQVGPSPTYSASLIGAYRYFVDVGNVALSHIYVDTTCFLADTLNAFAVKFYGPKTFRIRDSYIAMRALASPVQQTGGKCILWIADAAEPICTAAVNCYFEGTLVSAVAEVKTMSADTCRYVLRNCVARQIENRSVTNGFTGATVSHGSARNTVTWQDCIAIGPAGADDGAYTELTAMGSCTTTAINCGAWSWGTTFADIDSAVDTIVANPQFGYLPAGAVLRDSCVFPLSLAVRNLAAYQKMGSTTFTGAGLDASRHSATGYKYLATDTITPGVNYDLTSFARKGIPWFPFRWGFGF